MRWAKRRNGLRRCIHRLFAVWRSGSNRQRARLIADLRPFNALMPPPPPFTLPSVVDALPWHKVRYATKTDLDAAFWTLAVSQELAAAMTSADGREWAVLPFGYTWSPFIFHTCLEPVVAAMEVYGHRIVKYLDDFLVAEDDYDRCWQGTILLRTILSDLGFTVSRKKSCTEPQSRLVFLGMGLDLLNQWFFWPSDKAHRVSHDAATFLETPNRVPSGELRSWLGRTAFLATVCPLLACWRRSIEACLTASDGSTFIRLSPDARRELLFWHRQATSLAGSTFPWPTGQRWVVRTDASETSGGITVIWPSGRRSYSSILLPPDLIGTSSAEREVYVSVTAIHALVGVTGERPLYRARIDVYSDSTASTAALARGGRAPSMVPHTQRALAVSSALSATITPRWRPREQMQTEDDLSKRVDFHELRMIPALVSFLSHIAWHRPSPDYDMFAAAANTHASAYATRVPEDRPDADVGVDGLRCPVRPHTWAYPPMQLAKRAARALSAARVPALLIHTGTKDLPAATALFGATWVARIDVPQPLLLPPHFTTLTTPPSPLTAIAYHSQPLPHTQPGAHVSVTMQRDGSYSIQRDGQPATPTSPLPHPANAHLPTPSTTPASAPATAPLPTPHTVPTATAPRAFTWQEVHQDFFADNRSAHAFHCISAHAECAAGFAASARPLYERDMPAIRREARACITGTGTVQPQAVLSPRHSCTHWVHLVTKWSGRCRPTYQSLTHAFIHALQQLRTHPCSHIHMPTIGCGIDGLSWPRVRQELQRILTANPRPDGPWEVTVFQWP